MNMPLTPDQELNRLLKHINSPEAKEIFYENVLILAELAGLTIDSVLIKADLPIGSIEPYRNGEGTLGLETLKAIAGVFGFEADSKQLLRNILNENRRRAHWQTFQLPSYTESASRTGQESVVPPTTNQDWEKKLSKLERGFLALLKHESTQFTDGNLESCLAAIQNGASAQTLWYESTAAGKQLSRFEQRVRDDLKKVPSWLARVSAERIGDTVKKE